MSYDNGVNQIAMGWKKTVARLKEKIPSLRQTIVSLNEVIVILNTFHGSCGLGTI